MDNGSIGDQLNQFKDRIQQLEDELQCVTE